MRTIGATGLRSPGVSFLSTNHPLELASWSGPAAALTVLLVLALVLPVSAKAANPVPAGDPIGQVATLSGDAEAKRPGGASRQLSCGDPVYAGDWIQTPDNGRVGVLVGDVLAQLGEQTILGLGLTPAEAMADLRLQFGGVRVIDPRDGGATARLSVLDAVASVRGNDAEAYIFNEKAGSYALLCEWDTPLDVRRRQEGAVAEPGECVIAKPRQKLYTSKAQDERLRVGDACPYKPGSGLVAHHMPPIDVGLGPLKIGPELPTALGFPGRSACDEPGSGCGGVITLPPPPMNGGPGD